VRVIKLDGAKRKICSRPTQTMEVLRLKKKGCASKSGLSLTFQTLNIRVPSSNPKTQIVILL